MSKTMPDNIIPCCSFLDLFLSTNHYQQNHTNINAYSGENLQVNMSKLTFKLGWSKKVFLTKQIYNIFSFTKINKFAIISPKPNLPAYLNKTQ